MQQVGQPALERTQPADPTTRKRKAPGAATAEVAPNSPALLEGGQRKQATKAKQTPKQDEEELEEEDESEEEDETAAAAAAKEKAAAKKQAAVDARTAAKEHAAEKKKATAERAAAKKKAAAAKKKAAAEAKRGAAAAARAEKAELSRQESRREEAQEKVGKLVAGLAKAKSRLPASARAHLSHTHSNVHKPEDGSEAASEMKELFGEFDLDGDGKISMTELAKVMQALGHTMSHGEIEELLNQGDKDGDGSITYEEYVSRSGGLECCAVDRPSAR